VVLFEGEPIDRDRLSDWETVKTRVETNSVLVIVQLVLRISTNALMNCEMLKVLENWKLKSIDVQTLIIENSWCMIKKKVEDCFL